MKKSEQQDVFRIDGGFAWIVVIAGFTGSAMSLGTVYSLGGTFLPAWLDEFDAERARLAPAVSLTYFLTFGGGVFWSACIRRFGSFRIASIVGISSSTLAMLLMPFARTLGDVSLYFIFSIPFACGSGLLFFCSTTVITSWFVQRRGLAQGLGAAGSGTGVVIVTQILRVLIESYGWVVAARIFAVIYGIISLVAASCFRQPPQNAPTSPVAVQPAISISKRYAGLLTDPRMQVLCVSPFVSCIGFTMPYLFLADHITGSGHSYDFASLMVSVLGFGSILGRVVFPWIVDFGVHPVKVFSASQFILGFNCALLWPFCENKSSFIAFAVIEGFAMGAPVPMGTLVCARLFGMERFRDAFGIMCFFVGSGMFLSGVIGGLIFDATGSYMGTALVGGCVQLLAGIILQVVWLYEKPPNVSQQKEVQSIPTTATLDSTIPAIQVLPCGAVNEDIELSKDNSHIGDHHRDPTGVLTGPCCICQILRWKA